MDLQCVPCCHGKGVHTTTKPAELLYVQAKPALIRINPHHATPTAEYPWIANKKHASAPAPDESLAQPPSTSTTRRAASGFLCSVSNPLSVWLFIPRDTQYIDTNTPVYVVAVRA